MVLYTDAVGRPAGHSAWINEPGSLPVEPATGCQVTFTAKVGLTAAWLAVPVASRAW
jgi:hypothetical protein